MTEFYSFFKEGLDDLGFDSIDFGEKVSQSVDTPDTKCKYCCGCLSKIPVADPFCRRCSGQVFADIPDEKTADAFSGEYLYEVASRSTCDAAAKAVFLSVAAKKGYLKAVLKMAESAENEDNAVLAEQYYKQAATLGSEGKAGWIRFQFSQNPPFEKYEDLIVELNGCLHEQFSYLNPTELRQLFREKSDAYIKHCMAPPPPPTPSPSSSWSVYGQEESISYVSDSASSQTRYSTFLNRCLKDDLELSSSDEERALVMERYRSNHPGTLLDPSSVPSCDFDNDVYTSLLNDIM